jgi:hypothetical protein
MAFVSEILRSVTAFAFNNMASHLHQLSPSRTSFWLQHPHQHRTSHRHALLSKQHWLQAADLAGIEVDAGSGSVCLVIAIIIESNMRVRHRNVTWRLVLIQTAQGTLHNRCHGEVLLGLHARKGGNGINHLIQYRRWQR